MSWLWVIGIGLDGVAGLAPAARALLDQAELVVGGERHLAMLPTGHKAQRHVWPSPFSAAKPLLEGLRGRRVVVLASGEPLWFGAASTLLRWFDPSEITVVPHLGAFSLAAACLKWPLQDCLCLTAHGRPIEGLVLHLAAGRRLLVLSEDRTTPAKVAQLLAAKGFGQSRLWVLENLGGADERIIEGTDAGSGLNVVAVECAGRGLPVGFGLPDEAFEHDGQLTKREVRAVTLSSLAPLPGQMLWDVGAGSGSIAIEWMRAGGRAIAIEANKERAARIARNALELGVPGLEIIEGKAPDNLPAGAPDAIFVGGGVAVPGLLDLCWDRLGAAGRLVANAVTAEGEAALLAFHAANSGTLTRIDIARLAPVGRYHTWHPAMPVTQYVGVKSSEAEPKRGRVERPGALAKVSLASGCERPALEGQKI
jgi:precorrin-6Y C5,15-methyltransferase (decarboxylating)